MHQFFVEEHQINRDRVRICGEDVNHIANVLRMKPGERIRVVSVSGRAFFCHIEEIRPDFVVAAVDEVDGTSTELAPKIYLLQGLPKGDKMEFIVQKAVELGASEIVPVAMKNCVVKLDDRRAAGKVQRWQAIADSAAKQCKRTRIPTVHMPVGWGRALEMAEELDITLVPYENERGMEATRKVVDNIKNERSIGIMIGPEGGFAQEEIEAVTGENMHRISLGGRILRTETAGMMVLGVLVYRLDH